MAKRKYPKSKKIEDKIVNKWNKDESEVLFPAGKNIFGQPTEAMTREDLLMTVTGYVSPFSTIKAAKSFLNLWGAVKGWRGYGLPSWFSKSQANQIIAKTSKVTGVPKGKLLKFAEQKISGTKTAIKENRKFHEAYRKKHGKGWREDIAGPKGKWKGGIKYDIKNTVNDKDMSSFLNEAIQDATKR